MKIKVWGARGSVPAPGPEMNRFGGNTSCVQVTFRDGSQLILDAGTGIRTLGLELADASEVGIILTHLHLDHIQGLMFFPPCFRSDAGITIWGPSSPETSLENRIARYISAPLSPVEVRELPCSVEFHEAPRIRVAASATSRSAPRPSPIAGRRSAIASRTARPPSVTSRTTSRRSERRLQPSSDDWISGYDLAKDADLLIHDCQYTDEEYPAHVGWGHSAMEDTLTFAHRVGAKRVLLFHHDPLHTDIMLERMEAHARKRWVEMGHARASIDLAREGIEHEVTGTGPLVQAVPGVSSTAGTSAAAELSTRG